MENICVENVDGEIMDLLDISLPEELLNKRIREADDFKFLIILLKLKRRRILDGTSQKIEYNVQKIYEQKNEDLLLQCEVLKNTFFVIENLDEEILRVITYLNLNFQLNEFSNCFEFDTAFKLARLLNEIFVICKNQKVEFLFQENISFSNLDRFLFIGLKKDNKLRVYILSTVLPNYISVLSESYQQQFLSKSFAECKASHNLDLLCIIFNYVEENSVLTNCESLLYSENFWQYLEYCISLGSYSVQKQAIFLIKKWVNKYYDCKHNCEILYLQISECCESPKKIWQNFFTLLDASKEKQLHLVRPALTLLNSLNYLNSLWQICVFKKLLAHSQNIVVYFIGSHILNSGKFFPSLNKYLLAAINKNDYSNYCTKMFKAFPIFLNNLDMEHFILFLEDIIGITWTPTAVWCLFSNTFTETLSKHVPIKLIEPIYKLLKQLPHVYIRNGCISIFLNYVVKNFDWKSKFEDIIKLLSIIKHYDNDLFIKTVSDHIGTDVLNIILYKIQENNLEINTFEITVQIIKILEYETGIQAILENIKSLEKQYLLVVYSNLFKKCNVLDIEKFVLEQINEIDDNCAENFLSISRKVIKSQDFYDCLYRKMLTIVEKANSFSQTTLFVVLHLIATSYKEIRDVRYVLKHLKNQITEFGKINDDLYTIYLRLYFLTEEYPNKQFFEQILHNQSDVVISKMFKYFSDVDFYEISIDQTYFVKESLGCLLHLTKSKQFKSVIFNYINCIFSTSFLKFLTELGMLDLITLVTDSLVSLSEVFPIIDYFLSKILKEIIILSELDSEISFILIPAVCELSLKGVIVKKDDRVEYCVCQEIYDKFGNENENSNFIKIATRMFSLESMLHIASKKSKHADDIADKLMKKYKIYFNKRYFPDSQIHLQKLRIVQALLVIQPYIKNQKRPLIQLIMESFCTEIHQTCVKQLMQWLLLRLLNNQGDDYFNLIKTRIDTANKAQPSSIVAFIVVLVHLTLDRDESYWFPVAEALIPWFMGAHFKLRVFSQAAIKKLIEEAEQKSYETFLNKYGYLQKSVLSVIEASGAAFNDTLKSDQLFFTVFNCEKHYSLESIYVDIPKLNGVTRTEWENVLQYKFIANKDVIDVYNKDRSFSDAVSVIVENRSKEKISEDLFENSENVQRKITPCDIVGNEQETKQVNDFILIASLIEKSTNLGGLSRTCEVFGVKQLVLNDVKVLKDKEFKSLSMSSEDWINAVEVKIPEIKNFISQLRNEGYTVIGAEQTSESVCLNKYKFNKKTALVLGNEKEGIPPDIIPILDECIEIPQFGMVRSLNVHVAGATFIWEYAKQNLV